MASPTTISANLQQRLARVSEQFGSVSGGVVIKEEDDDDEDEEEEELAVNHSGMWNFGEFWGIRGIFGNLGGYGGIWFHFRLGCHQ